MNIYVQVTMKISSHLKWKSVIVIYLACTCPERPVLPLTQSQRDSFVNFSDWCPAELY